MKVPLWTLKPQESTIVWAVVATIAVIILFLGETHAQAKSKAMAKELYTVCAKLKELAPEIRSHRRIVDACAHPEWFHEFAGSSPDE